VAEIEHQHRDLGGGGARAAVFGFSDGLVTNVSLILGVAAAHPGGTFVRLAGVAGLVAGAFSMGAGEYVSMSAQRELMQRELDIEQVALKRTPDLERDELLALYRHRGLDADLARELVDAVMQDPDLALETHAREELGFTPSSLRAPLQATVSSFMTFAAGALLPLIPWLIGEGTAATLASVAIGVVAALTVGMVLGIFTGRSKWRSAFRQLAIAAVAAGVTYGIGRLVGASGV